MSPDMSHLTDDQLSARLDEALPAAASAQADAHLAQCEACRARLAELGANDAALATALTHDPGEAYFESFADSVAARIEMPVNIRPTGPTIQTHGSSDHASFNAVGVPGFFWDEVGKAEYGYAWHTQYDRLDLAIPEYLTQSSTCSAVTAYNLACAPSMLPRAQRNPEGARPQRRVNPNRVNDSLAGRPDGTESGGPDRPARPARPTNAPAAPATAEPSK